MSDGTILSFGAGVNSVALLLRMIADRDKPDLVIFADTGDEMDDAHAVAAHAEILCRENGVEFVTVRRSKLGIIGESLLARIIPLPHRGIRSCTEKFKVRPIRKEMRRRGMKKATMLIGIAKDEAHRMKDSNVKWILNEWPLVYRYGMDRAACHETIDALWDGPPVGKSGCNGCPFIGVLGYLHMARTNRAKFDLWEEVERNAKGYPQNRFFNPGPTLAEIRVRADTETTLESFERPSIECGIGACSPDPQPNVVNGQVQSGVSSRQARGPGGEK